MPSLPLETDAFVLLAKPAADTFRQFTVFSGEHGNLLCLQRIAARRRTDAAPAALDLFDEVHLFLESANQGRTWFVQESRLLARPAGIGRSYEALAAASRFVALIARNPVHEDSRAQVYALLRQSLDAFAETAPPALVFFKSLYCFARNEGYPVKQDWAQGLPEGLRATAARLLNSPLAALTEEDARAVSPLLTRLERWIAEKTEIISQ